MSDIVFQCASMLRDILQGLAQGPTHYTFCFSSSAITSLSVTTTRSMASADHERAVDPVRDYSLSCGTKRLRCSHHEVDTSYSDAIVPDVSQSDQTASALNSVDQEICVIFDGLFAERCVIAGLLSWTSRDFLCHTRVGGHCDMYRVFFLDGAEWRHDRAARTYGLQRSVHVRVRCGLSEDSRTHLRYALAASGNSSIVLKDSASIRAELMHLRGAGPEGFSSHSSIDSADRLLLQYEQHLIAIRDIMEQVERDLKGFFVDAYCPHCQRTAEVDLV